MNKLSKTDILNLYDFLYKYENELKNKAGHYHVEDLAMKQFLKSKSIFIGALNGKTKCKNYVKCDMRSGRKVSQSDLGHHIFRHVRNSIAHGLIKKEQKSFVLKDFRNDFTGLKESACAKIEVNLFWELLNKIEQTYI
ncbi:MAG: hypothetical protein ACI30B_04540 [Paludibacteraceae bacterium]